MIEGYFLYSVDLVKWSNESFSFVYPIKIYETLSGAKNASIVKKNVTLKNRSFVIVPIKCAFDKNTPIKYMFINGSWTKELDKDIAIAFYDWRDR